MTFIDCVNRFLRRILQHGGGTESLNDFSNKTIEKESPFKPNWLKWPTMRKKHPFRVYVVEPHEYSPRIHEGLFYATFNYLLGLNPSCDFIDDITPTPRLPVQPPERFDLVIFPEAFLPSDVFLKFIEDINKLPSSVSLIGCIHVGIRPPATEDTEDTILFVTRELVEFLNRLRSLDNVVSEDLDTFSQWLEEQPEDDNFNIGCLFLIEPDLRVRICLHPKLVRSRYEKSLVSDIHMAEANLLSLVTLHPQDHRFPSITIQPLICSDVFLKDTDRPDGNGLEAMASYAHCFHPIPPEHIDVVSLCTLTPTRKRESPDGMTEDCFEWRQAFRESFVSAAKGGRLFRHRNAVFILSNYLWFPPMEGCRDRRPAGLSGVFVPFPPFIKDKFPQFAALDVYARSNDNSREEMSWMNYTEYLTIGKCDQVLGCLVSLDRNKTWPHARATIISWDIDKLPQWASHFNRDQVIVNLKLFHVIPDSSLEGPSFRVIQEASHEH
ncbi:MAG: hypothetical protein PHU25_01160 [Deltaproteobacteria bacterium]|nr:hypothetical protein [Deltaproteobacteria bacterium]